MGLYDIFKALGPNIGEPPQDDPQPAAPQAPQSLDDLKAQQGSGLVSNLNRIGSQMPVADDEKLASIPPLVLPPGLGTSVMPPPQGASRGVSASDSAPAADSKDAPKSDKELIRDYLKKKYGFGPGDDADALVEMQKSKDQGVGAANKFEAIARMGAALSGSQNVQPDKSFYEGLKKQSGSGVEDLLQRRAAQTEGLKNESQIDALAKEQEANDPSSSYSQSVKKAYGGILHKLGFDPSITAEMSASQILDGLKDPMHLKAQYDETMARIQENHLMRKAMMDQKQGNIQDAAKADAVKALEGLKARGSVKNAFEANRRGANVLSLLAQYPDLDKMPEPKVRLLQEEMSGMINGGAPTVQGAHGVISPTAAAKLSSALNYITNAQNGAQLKGQIEQYVPYIKDVMKNSNNIIKTSQDQILTGFNKKARKEDLDEVRKSFEGDLSNPDAVVASASGQQQQMTPDVLKYAEDHKITPEKALEIKLKRTGGAQ